MVLGRSADHSLAGGRTRVWEEAHVAIVVYQGAPTAREVVLLEDCDLKSSLCEACCCCNAANTSA